MANHAFIFEQEEHVLRATEAVKDLLQAYAYECSMNVKPRCNPENRDQWGTAWMNVGALQNACAQFLKAAFQDFPNA